MVASHNNGDNRLYPSQGLVVGCSAGEQLELGFQDRRCYIRGYLPGCRIQNLFEPTGTGRHTRTLLPACGGHNADSSLGAIHPRL